MRATTRIPTVAPIIPSSVASRLRSTAPLPGPYFGKYPIPVGDAEKYGGIFSLIVSIEALEGYYSEGGVIDEHDKILETLLKQLRAIQEALGLTKEHLQDFCRAAHIDPRYFFGALDRDPNSLANVDPELAKAAAEYGLMYQTLLDMLSTEVTSIRMVHNQVNGIWNRVVPLRLDESQEVRDAHRKIVDLLLSESSMDARLNKGLAQQLETLVVAWDHRIKSCLPEALRKA